jgi:hypothetical protein
MNKTIKEKLELLTLPYWKNSQIQKYFGVSQHTAEKIIYKAVDNFNGEVAYIDNETKKYSVAKTNSILLVMGSESRLEEAKVLKALL